jgi:hypothetical protein
VSCQGHGKRDLEIVGPSYYSSNSMLRNNAYMQNFLMMAPAIAKTDSFAAAMTEDQAGKLLKTARGTATGYVRVVKASNGRYGTQPDRREPATGGALRRLDHPRPAPRRTPQAHLGSRRSRRGSGPRLEVGQ